MSLENIHLLMLARTEISHSGVDRNNYSSVTAVFLSIHSNWNCYIAIYCNIALMNAEDEASSETQMSLLGEHFPQ